MRKLTGLFLGVAGYTLGVGTMRYIEAQERKETNAAIAARTPLCPPDPPMTVADIPPVSATLWQPFDDEVKAVTKDGVTVSAEIYGYESREAMRMSVLPLPPRQLAAEVLRDVIRRHDLREIDPQFVSVEQAAKRGEKVQSVSFDVPASSGLAYEFMLGMAKAQEDAGNVVIDDVFRVRTGRIRGDLDAEDLKKALPAPVLSPLKNRSLAP